MPLYSYKAADSSGKIIKGTMEAPQESAVVSRIQDMGCIPIRIVPAAEGGRFSGILSKSLPHLFSLFNRPSIKDVMHFTQDLSVLLEAGLPMDKALSVLIDVAEKETFRDVIHDVLKDVQGGSGLSDALSKHPKVFSTFYTNMVRAGEAGGVLESVLGRLASFMESSQELRDYIKSAMVYPLFLVFVGGASIIIMLTFVLPKFSIIFSDMGQAIPASTRILLGLSDFLRRYWWIIVLFLVVVWVLVKRHTNTPEGRFKLDRYKITLPIIGDLVKMIEVARFSRTLGTLTKSGVPILQAINLVKDIIGNSVIVNTLMKVYERVKEGDRLSKPLSESGIFPSLAVQMIAVGEETGRLDDMLLRVAENYEKVVRNMVKRLISFLEPAMILFMGLVVGFIVVSMLMAVFSMNELPF